MAELNIFTKNLNMQGCAECTCIKESIYDIRYKI